MHPDASGAAQIRYTFADETKRRELNSIAKDECKAIQAGRYKLDNHSNNFYEQCQYIETHGREAIFELPIILIVEGLVRTGLAKTISDAGDKILPMQWKEDNVTPRFYYDFNDADTRKGITAQPYEVKSEGTPSKIKQVTTNIITIQLAKWRAEWSKAKITSTEDGVSPIVLRYADILLMFAEADLYLGGTEGATYLNQVRRRAFGLPLDQTSAYDVAFTLDNIKQERAFEFCGENIRKYDLIRWGELKSKMDEAKAKLARLRDGLGNMQMCLIRSIPKHT
jgi:hypothetical protein